MESVWVLGDQLNRCLGPLRLATPVTSRVLMVESRAKLASKPWHRQRAHLVICAMRRFAAELAAEGFEVDYRRSPSLAAGLRAHRAEHTPSRVVAMEPASCWGSYPDGTWATSRGEALRRLDHVIEAVMPVFGPHEDAMLSTSWHLAHTLLSPYLNLGLLLPGEVCDAAEAAFRRGDVPIASAEGFIRQVIGWREYVWGRYWQWMPDYRGANELSARRSLPPVFSGAPTRMRCVSQVMHDVGAHGYTHHIARLMILGNLALLAGIDPWELTDWMWSGFVDGAEWVMLPNVIGMALHADGGRMATSHTRPAVPTSTR